MKSPDRSRAISFALLALFTLAAAAAIAVALWRRDVFLVSPRYIAFYLGLPAMMLAAAIIGLFLPPTGRIVTALSLIGVIASLYAAELMFSLRTPPQSEEAAWLNAAAQAARAAGKDFDARPLMQVVRDLRSRGDTVYPMFTPNGELQEQFPLLPDGRRLFAVSSIPNVTNVYCNEGDGWFVWKSDHFGFNNPDDIWSRPAVDLAITGNSWALGACLPTGRSMPDLLRQKVPSLVNVSTGGSGPLVRLAQITEYLPLARPRRVLWIATPADFHIPLQNELAIPALRGYLDGRTQDLVSTNPAIGMQMRQYWEEALPRVSADGRRPSAGSTDRFSMVKLQALRNRLGLNSCPPRSIDGGLIAGIFTQARRSVESWGGKLMVVFIPIWADCDLFNPENKTPTWYHQKIIDAVAAAGVEMIDLRPALLAGGNPKSLFFFRGSHFNDRGAAVAAQAILSALKLDRRPAVPPATE